MCVGMWIVVCSVVVLVRGLVGTAVSAHYCFFKADPSKLLPHLNSTGKWRKNSANVKIYEVAVRRVMKIELTKKADSHTLLICGLLILTMIYALGF